MNRNELNIGDKITLVRPEEFLYNHLEKYYKTKKHLVVLKLEDAGVVVGKKDGSVYMCIAYERVQSILSVVA